MDSSPDDSSYMDPFSNRVISVLTKGIFVLLYISILFLVIFTLAGGARLVPVIISPSNNTALSDVVSSLGNVAAALGTVLLVIVTYYYVDKTSELVNVTQNQLEKERENRKEMLRQSIHAEIQQPDWDRWVDHPGDLPQYALGWTSVFDNQIGNIGLLEKDERDSIYDYYDALKNLRATLANDPVSDEVEGSIREIRGARTSATEALHKNSSELEEDEEREEEEWEETTATK